MRMRKLSDGKHNAWSDAIVSENEAISPAIDNSDLFDAGRTNSSRLRADLKEFVDFVAVPQEIWDELKQRCGLVSAQHSLPRQTYARTDSKWALEIYPAVLDVHYKDEKLESQRSSIEFSLGDTLDRIKDKIRERIPCLRVQNLDVYAVKKDLNGEKRELLASEFFTFTELHLERARRLEVQPSLEQALVAVTVEEALPAYDGACSSIAAPITIRGDPMDSCETEVDLTKSNDAPLLLANSSTSSAILPIVPLRTERTAISSRYTSARRALPIGATGLQNLGNTCFMNSALQCLSNTAPLTKYFIQNKWEAELNPENPLGMRGQVAEAYAELTKQLWRPNEDRNSSYAPRPFKSTIGRFNSMFAGYSQQDSQELLGFLVDGLHEDLNRIKKKPYVEAPDMDGQPDEVVAAKAWEIYCLRNDSIVVDLFQGQYKSRVECIECGKLSVTFDPYMFLSVPIPDHRFVEVKVIGVSHVTSVDPNEEEAARSLLLSLPRDSTIAALRKAVAARMGWSTVMDSESALSSHVVEIYNGAIYRFLQDADSITSIAAGEIIWVVEFGEPDWDLFEVPPEERTPLNTRQIPVFFTEPPERNQFGGSAFGVPLMVSIPAIVPASSDRHRSAEDVFAERVYRVLVRSLRKYAQFPLFTTAHKMNLREVYELRALNPDYVEEHRRRLSLSSTSHESLQGEANAQTDHPSPDQAAIPHSDSTFLTNEDTGIDCEPIEDLFELYKATPKSPATDSNLFYYRGWHENGSRKELLYSGREARLQREKRELADEEQSTDADDEASDPDVPPAVTQRSPQGSRSYMDLTRRQSALSTSAFDGPTLLLMEWSPSYRNYTLYKDIDRLPVTEDLRNEEVRQEHISAQKAANAPVTLQSCLDEYRKEETLGDDNSWYCPRCRDHRPTKKKLDIWTVPEILVFHLKRFSNTGRGYRSMMGDKIDTFVDAPVHGLDLTDVVLGKHPARKWQSQESVRTDNHAEMEAGSDNVEPGNLRPHSTVHDSDTDDRLVYDLFAVSNHFGGLGGGHYTAFAKNCVDDQWYNFDDSQVSKIDEESVLTSAAYFLFYQRRYKGNKPDLSGALEDLRQRNEAEEAAAALLKSQKTSSHFLSKPSSSSCGSSDIRSSRRPGEGLGLVSPITTSADTTHNNSLTNSPNGSGTLLSSGEDANESQPVQRHRNSSRHSHTGRPSAFGPRLPSVEGETVSQIGARFTFGQASQHGSGESGWEGRTLLSGARSPSPVSPIWGPGEAPNAPPWGDPSTFMDLPLGEDAASEAGTAEVVLEESSAQPQLPSDMDIDSDGRGTLEADLLAATTEATADEEEVPDSISMSVAPNSK
ncbi:CSN-associated deubiquitinating enzyme Ubp12 [Thoreauomyces humboldtii]|nr:CSN-associated deubiquitinating enzyme Ubp12 [Thoreauomyces humboldtii]